MTHHYFYAKLRFLGEVISNVVNVIDNHSHLR
jgi:hypothetical protein